MLAWKRFAWCGNGITPVDARRNDRLQRILRLFQSLDFVRPGGQTLRQVAERDDDLARAGVLETRSISETQGTLYLSQLYFITLRCVRQALSSSIPGSGRVHFAVIDRKFER